MKELSYQDRFQNNNYDFIAPFQHVKASIFFYGFIVQIYAEMYRLITIANKRISVLLLRLNTIINFNFCGF